MRFVSLQSKDVINVYDGKKIGYIADIELDWCQKCIRALIVEKMNFFHFFPPCIPNGPKHQIPAPAESSVFSL